MKVTDDELSFLGAIYSGYNSRTPTDENNDSVVKKTLNEKEQN